ncbi:hypothetical protein JCM10450v2_001132 [Rhodotorula kratochvilovae]
MAPWLSALAQHPVFTLPPPALDDLPAAATPQQTAGLARSSAALGRSAPLSQSASSRSLFGLSTASPSSSSPSSNHVKTPLKRNRSTNKGAHAAGVEKRIKGGRTSRMVVARGTDLVVAVGSELRIASLADVKGRCAVDEDLDAEDVELGDYKVLNTPIITFEIQQLVLNPTSKLLAVIGAHSVVVVVLPRRGWANNTSKTLECRCLPVGAFYHSLPGSPPVASALWHPLGLDASSLLILTTDCTLREYTVSDTVEEPAQTLSFSRSRGEHKPAGRSFGLSAVDRDASTAVAMCVGEGGGDWGPLTLYALMRSGDIVAMCPFLPKKASLSPSYVHALSAFVSTKLDYLSSSAAPSDPFASSASSSLTSFSAHEKRYSLQQQYVSSLVRQVTTTPTASTPALLSSDTHDDAHDPSAPRAVVAPSRPALAPRLQGPFLLQPAPAELDNGADPAACDLAYVAYSARAAAGEGDEQGGDGVDVFAVAYRDGKVDLCLEVEKVEARFVGEAPSATLARNGAGAVVLHPSRRPRGGFGAADLSSDEEADEEDAEDLPTLAVYESLDLGLSAALSPSADERVVARALAHNAPAFARDPLYADTLYVRHALGAHCLFLGPWLRPMAEALALAARGEEEEGDDELEKELGAVLAAKSQTGVCWVLSTVGAPGVEGEAAGEDDGAPPVEGLALVNDVFLGYSLLLVTSALQLVGVELALRVDPDAGDIDGAAPATPAAAASAAPSEPAYLSLLDTPFVVPALLSRQGQPAVPHLPSTKKELSITPDTLRALGTHVSSVQTAVRDLVSAADAVQARLELQMQELARQVSKLRDLDTRRAELGRSIAPSGAGGGGLAARVRTAEETQRALLARTDAVLQRLMESHQPQLSTFERKWFDELARVRDQVDGGDEGDGGLALRAQRLQAQLELLRPELEEMKRREEARRAGGTPARGRGMGHAQLETVESRLSQEAKLLADAKRKVERLTSTLAAASLA